MGAASLLEAGLLGLISDGEAGIPRGKGGVPAKGAAGREAWGLGGEQVAGESFVEAKSQGGNNQPDKGFTRGGGGCD